MEWLNKHKTLLGILLAVGVGYGVMSTQQKATAADVVRNEKAATNDIARLEKQQEAIRKQQSQIDSALRSNTEAIRYLTREMSRNTTANQAMLKMLMDQHGS